MRFEVKLKNADSSNDAVDVSVQTRRTTNYDFHLHILSSSSRS